MCDMTPHTESGIQRLQGDECFGFTMRLFAKKGSENVLGVKWIHFSLLASPWSRNHEEPTGLCIAVRFNGPKQTLNQTGLADSVYIETRNSGGFRAWKRVDPRIDASFSDPKLSVDGQISAFVELIEEFIRDVESRLS